MKKIGFVSTVPYAFHVFMRKHISLCADRYKVSLITSPHSPEVLEDYNVEVISSVIKREPAILSDCLLFFQLFSIFRRGKFDLIHSITPKAGFFSMAVGRVCGVPIRIHTFTGQVWATQRGLKRVLFKFIDRLTVFFATHILVDSPSQLLFMESEGVIKKGEGIVIGSGSVCGVDLEKFHPNPLSRLRIRSELHIDVDDTVILFMGRLNVDKGVLDLIKAFIDISSKYTNVVLMIVGSEEGLTFLKLTELLGSSSKSARMVSFTKKPEAYMAAADILCLPSYREGFGQVIVDAAGCGLPCVGSKIYGITDAIVDGSTGILVFPGNVTSLYSGLVKLISNKSLRTKMGISARQRVVDSFSDEFITSELMLFYAKLFK